MALSDASTDLLLILDDLTHRRLVLLKSCSSASCSAVAAHFSCGTYDHPASKYTLPQMARLLDLLQPGESLMTLHLSHCVLTSSLPVYTPRLVSLVPPLTEKGGRWALEDAPG